MALSDSVTRLFWPLLLVLVLCPGCSTNGTGGSEGDAVDVVGSTELEIVINEVVAFPLFGGGDWVELRNLSQVEGSLEGWSLRDESDAHVHLLGAESVISAGGHLVVTDLESPLTGGFGLGASDSVRLIDPSGEEIDAVQWGAGECPLGRSWGRSSEGSGEVGMLAIPTPAEANSEWAIAATEGPIRINEVVASPAGEGGDWFELYNESTEVVSLQGWVVSDTPSQIRSAWTPLPDIALEPGEHVVLERTPGDGGGDFDFGLGSADELHLVTASDAVSDSLVWSAGQAPLGGSFGRVPDGAGMGVTLAPPTPGATNVQEAPVLEGAVIVTEFLANPVATEDADGEWVELFNTTAEVIDLGGWLLSDGDGGIHVIGGGDSLEIAGHSHVVLGRSGDTSSNGAVSVHDVHGDTLALANVGDVLELRVAGVLMDRVAFDSGSWGLQAGRAHALDPNEHTAASNDDPAHWCPADEAWSDGDAGSPGEINPACASDESTATP